MKSEYLINDEGANYVKVRTEKSKKEIFVAIVLTIFLPLGFIALKSNFFQKINPPIIFAGVFMFAFCGYVFLYKISKTTKAIKNIVKKLSFHEDGYLKIMLVNNDVVFSLNMENVKLYEGYNGSEKMKNIFDEPTYRLEDQTQDLTIFLISTYFTQWDEILFKLQNEKV